jgi:PadR family transcriptional regulator, regulatory protein AphA
MSELSIRLSPTSYLILGLISYRGPSTPYQLKRAVGRSVGYFWPFPHTQLYEEPSRLARAGLLVEQREEDGRRRRTYTITEAGREALAAWLHEPTTDIMQVRDLAQLQLFFSEFMSTEDLVAMAREQVRLYDQRLAEYEAIAARYANRPELGRRMASLDLGVRVTRTVHAYWRDIAANPPCCVRDEARSDGQDDQ